MYRRGEKEGIRMKKELDWAFIQAARSAFRWAFIQAVRNDGRKRRTSAEKRIMMKK